VPDGIRASCSAPVESIFSTVPESLPLLLPQQIRPAAKKKVPQTTISTAKRPELAKQKTIIYFFWGKGCPHCEEERQFLDDRKRELPSLEIRDFEVWHNRENAGFMAEMLRANGVESSGVPVTFVSDKMFSGFTARSMAALEKEIKKCSLVPCADPAEVLKKTTTAEIVQGQSFCRLIHSHD
jgi:glutaredoxin